MYCGGLVISVVPVRKTNKNFGVFLVVLSFSVL